MDAPSSFGPGMFSVLNMDLARRYWYTVAGFVGALMAIRAVNFYKAHARLRRKAATSVDAPTKPSGIFLRVWATLTAVVREASTPQLHVRLRGLSWLTPPPLGRVIALLVYWIVIIYMMSVDVVVDDAFYWERIGFRNGWVTITQLPLLYLLASKCSVVGFLVGTSHERLNWLHRWVGRTMFVTATVHGWHFYTDWARVDFVQHQLDMMPSLTYGFGAWAVLLWTLVSGLAPLRRLAYEVFVAQHLLSAVFMLWLVYVHVPRSARYNVWFAIAALCFDRACRTAVLLWHNVRLVPGRAPCAGGRRIGHRARLAAVSDAVAVVTVEDVHFAWRAGQHVYLWLPRVGAAEAHPYTIAGAHRRAGAGPCSSLQLVVRKHCGFSRRLCAAAARAGTKHATAFVSGPYGAPPRWDIYETVVLIAASTGASFTLPILEALLQDGATSCAKRVAFLLAAKQADEIDFYVSRLRDLLPRARDRGIELAVHVAITQGGAPAGGPGTGGPGTDVRVADPASSSGSQLAAQADEKTPGAEAADAERDAGRPGSAGGGDAHIVYSSARPDVEAFIRGPVEATGGETSVVVCGGLSLSSRVRNCVAGLSNARAVHKGTGAQGIHLHVEEFSF